MDFDVLRPSPGGNYDRNRARQFDVNDIKLLLQLGTAAESIT